MTHPLTAALRRRLRSRQGSPSRRDLLQATGALAAGFVFDAGLHLKADTAPASKAGKRIVVIGGGLGGLAAAYELVAVGVDVTLLEASDRTGGRARSLTDFVKGKVVEAGGEFIGSNHPTWVGYAKRFGLELHAVEEDEDDNSRPVVLDGQRLPAKDAEELLDEMEEAFSLMNSDAVGINAEQPWLSPKAKDFDRTTMYDWIAGQKVSARCKQGLTVHFTAENAVAINRQSYLAMLAHVKGGGLDKFWTDSEAYRCVGGLQQLADRLAREIGTQRVRLDSPVKAVTMTDRAGTVTLVDGTTLTADHVVLAVPPTVWNRITFEPALPAELTLQLGPVVKFLAAFKSSFWDDDDLSPDSLGDGPVAMTWDATDGQDDTESDEVCLTANAGGPPAEIGRAWPDEQREANYLTALEKLYPNARKEFERSRFVNWPSEPWIAGGYSFPAPGQLTRTGPILKRGLGRLHFVGEHVSPAFFGFMEGALATGVAVAKRVAT